MASTGNEEEDTAVYRSLSIIAKLSVLSDQSDAAFVRAKKLTVFFDA